MVSRKVDESSLLLPVFVKLVESWKGRAAREKLSSLLQLRWSVVSVML